MHIYFGSDHRGFPLKEKLKDFLGKRRVLFTDLGCFSEESADYPFFAREVVEKVLEDEESFGVLICGTGIGMSMAANKFRGIRAALCFTPEMADATRRHNNANILCLGADVVTEATAEAMVERFLGAKFEGGRHERRVCMFDECDSA